MNQFNAKHPLRQPWVALGFKHKKDWAAALQHILKTSPHGHRIEDGHNYIMAALAQHPEAEEKIGCGADYFVTGFGPDKYGSTGFYLVRTDGSLVNFSYRVGMNGRPNPWAAFCSALREAVSYDVLDWKNTQFKAGPVPCPLCGRVMDRKDAHADHTHPVTFNSLAKEFAEDHGIEPSAVLYKNVPMYELADEALEVRWVQFHQARAVLRLLCAGCNTRIGARSAA